MRLKTRARNGCHQGKIKARRLRKKERTELGGGMFSDMELVQMLCNLGNKEGIEKICAVGTEQRPTVQSMYFRNSSLWVTDNIEATRENLLSYLGQELGAGGIKYAQAKINAAGQQKDIKFDLDRRTTGFTPVAVETVGAVIETPQGTVTFSGGYFPLVRDRGREASPKAKTPLRIIKIQVAAFEPTEVLQKLEQRLFIRSIFPRIAKCRQSWIHYTILHIESYSAI